MRVGIVGAEAAKFTAQGEVEAKALIRWLLLDGDAVLVSGHCHLGGIDIWAEEIAAELGRETLIYTPEALAWTFYKYRNMRIAASSDIVHCIVVDDYPPDYKGMRFDLCYHCKRNDHVKSGGCWTMHRATLGLLHIVNNKVAA